MSLAKSRLPAHRPGTMLSCLSQTPSRSWMGEQVFSSRPNTALRSGTADHQNHESGIRTKRDLDKIYPQEFYRSHDSRNIPKRNDQCHSANCSGFYTGPDARICEKCYKKYLRTSQFSFNDPSEGYIREISAPKKKRGDFQVLYQYKYQNKPYCETEDSENSIDWKTPRARGYKQFDRHRSGQDVNPSGGQRPVTLEEPQEAPEQCSYQRTPCASTISVSRPCTQGGFPCPTPIQSPRPQTVCSRPQTVCPRPQTVCPRPQTGCLRPQTVCPRPQTVCPRPQTVCSRPQTVCPRRIGSTCDKFSTFQRQLSSKRKDLENFINHYIAQNEERCNAPRDSQRDSKKEAQRSQRGNICSHSEGPAGIYVEHLINTLPKVDLSDKKPATAPEGDRKKEEKKKEKDKKKVKKEQKAAEKKSIISITSSQKSEKRKQAIRDSYEVADVFQEETPETPRSSLVDPSHGKALQFVEKKSKEEISKSSKSSKGSLTSASKSEKEVRSSVINSDSSVSKKGSILSSKGSSKVDKSLSEATESIFEPDSNASKDDSNASSTKIKERLSATSTKSQKSSKSSKSSKKSSASTASQKSDKKKHKSKNHQSCKDDCIFDCSRGEVTKFCQTFFEDNKKRIESERNQSANSSLNSDTSKSSQKSKKKSKGSPCTNKNKARKSGHKKDCKGDCVETCNHSCAQKKKRDDICPQKKIDCVDVCSHSCARKRKDDCVDICSQKCARKRKDDCADNCSFSCTPKKKTVCADSCSFVCTPKKKTDCADDCSFVCTPKKKTDCADSCSFACTPKKKIDCADTRSYRVCAPKKKIDCVDICSRPCVQKKKTRCADSCSYVCTPRKKPERVDPCAPVQKRKECPGRKKLKRPPSQCSRLSNKSRCYRKNKYLCEEIESRRKRLESLRASGGYCRYTCPVAAEMACLEEQRQRILDQKARAKLLSLHRPHVHSKSQLRMIDSYGWRHRRCFEENDILPVNCKYIKRLNRSLSRILTKSKSKKSKSRAAFGCGVRPVNCGRTCQPNSGVLCNVSCFPSQGCSSYQCAPAPCTYTPCAPAPCAPAPCYPTPCAPAPCAPHYCAPQMSTEEYLQLIGRCTQDRARHLNHLMRYKIEWYNRCLQQKYDQMLCDVTLLLEKQQEKFSQAFETRHNALKYQIQGLCNELHQYNPNFNFEEFYRNPCKYINQGSECCVTPRTPESCASSIEKAQQSVSVLENRLKRLKEENQMLELQLAHTRQEQQQILASALESEANAQQKNCELRDCQYELANKFQNVIQCGQNVIQCGQGQERQMTTLPLSWKCQQGTSFR